ncbi:MAG TPA: hypothetical protein VKZ18_11930 [Polyangia bacterium]|nr:hypothetical protein [Polyangia bacterium]
MSHIRSARRHALLAFAAVLVLAPAASRAAPPPASAPVDQAALGAERARLRGELERVNAEIDALKKASRGVGDDYRLRARMADAEALARRLIDIEARLGVKAPASNPGPLPVASPTDGPADLEAKADILADRSRRVRLEAETLDHRLAELKGRQTLRRRAADLDRDPFAPLEGSKRRVASIAAGADSGSHTAGATPSTSGTFSPQPPTTDRPVGGGPLSISNSSSPTTGSAPPVPVAMPATTTLSLELRDLLDPATVADIRRLEGAKASGSSLQALERAVAALRARADTLDGQARAMRQTARAPR